MEALLLLLLEPLGALLAPLAALLGSLISAVISVTVALLELVFSAGGRLRHRRASKATPPPKTTAAGHESPRSRDQADAKRGHQNGNQSGGAGSQPVRPRRRWLRRVIIGLAVVLVAAVVVVRLMIDPLIDRALAKVEQAHGVQVSMRERSISMFTGTVTCEGVRVSSPQHPVAAADLTAERVLVNVSIWSLLSGTVRLETVAVSGVRGTLVLTPAVSLAPRHREPRDFTIDDLQLRDVVVDAAVVGPRQTTNGRIQIDHWQTQPLRRQSAVFDVLYRTQANGALFGAPFTITTNADTASGRGTEQSRQTEWSVPGVPVAVLAASGLTPLTWFNDGTVDIRILDTWHLGEEAQIVVRYDLIFHNLQVAPPAGLSVLQQRVATQLQAWCERQGGSVSLGFEVVVDGDQVDGTFTPDMAEFADAVLRAVLAAAATSALADPVSDAEPASEDTSSLREGVRGAGMRAVGELLQRWP